MAAAQEKKKRKRKNTLSDNTAEGNTEERMERGHSGAQQDSVREDINCVVRQLVAWLLCYCLITDLHLVISAAVGAADMTVIV